MLNVLVVDDSAVYRKIMKLAVEQTGLARVVATVADGEPALLALKEQSREQRIDVVLLDVHLPGVDGLSLLARIRAVDATIKVVMVTGSSVTAAAETAKALEHGAVDLIKKPLNESYEKNMELVSERLRKLFGQWMSAPSSGHEAVHTNVESGDRNGTSERARRGAAESGSQGESVSQPVPVPRDSGAHPESRDQRRKSGRQVDLLVIAASTGGPAALEELIPALPGALRVPAVIVQHMPGEFTRMLAQSLAQRSGLDVREARRGERPEPGRIYVAPGGLHLKWSRQGAESLLVVEDGPTLHGVRPAVDVLLQSLAEQMPGIRVLVVILTGMGADGAAGVKRLRERADCYCLAQDEASSVVYGMPRSAVEAGVVDESLSLSRMAARIYEIVQFGGIGRGHEPH